MLETVPVFVLKGWNNKLFSFKSEINKFLSFYETKAVNSTKLENLILLE